MAERIGFVGLGRMGGPMAKNLARKQMSLTLFDISEARMEEVAAVGGRKADSVAELAAESDIVVTMLPGPPEVETVVQGAGGVLESLKAGGLVLDMSTVLPQTTDALAAACAEAGAEFVDAPVGRLASHAEKGESLFMVGASDAGFARVKPLLEAMGSTIHRCGGPGSGTRTKLVNNFLAITSCIMNAEAMALSQAFGLDLPTTLDVIHGTTATNGQLKINYATKVFRGDAKPGFAIDLAHKDLSLILDSANRERVPLPIVAVARESLSQARASGWGGKDFSALCDFWCDRSGVEKPRLDE
jgi:4-hydroxybutyrate dehydrogenase/sulfolactaldehyde 3-reductase